nr:protein eceriferum 1-like [Tanacetum cinerariifolium]
MHIVLVSTESFNPPAFMHLWLFELARDALNSKGFQVVRGFVTSGMKFMLIVHVLVGEIWKSSGFGWCNLTYKEMNIYHYDESECIVVRRTCVQTYIKIAQAISSQPDLVPLSYLDELSLLQDRISPFSNSYLFSLLLVLFLFILKFTTFTFYSHGWDKDSSRNGRKSIYKKRQLLQLSLLHYHRGGQGYEDTKYLMKRQKQTSNSLIEEALLESEAKGMKIYFRGELNRSGELFIRKNPQTKVKVVDRSTLAVAVVLNNIPKGSTQVVFKGNFDKVLSLLEDVWSVRIVEHLLLALEGTGVDNCRIEIISSHHNDTSAEFRQLPPNEMPIDAADCWVVKLKCSNSWLSCVRITDRSACAHEKDVTTPNKEELIRAFNDGHKAVCKELKSFAISDVQALPLRKLYCQIYQVVKHMLKGRLLASFQDREYEDGDTRSQGGIKDNDLKIKIQDHSMQMISQMNSQEQSSKIQERFI